MNLDHRFSSAFLYLVNSEVFLYLESCLYPNHSELTTDLNKLLGYYGPSLICSVEIGQIGFFTMDCKIKWGYGGLLERRVRE